VFDLRYHVVSLAAVFVALVVGILVGVGLSGKGFVNDAERANLTGQIADLRHERDAARESLDAASRGALALRNFADAAYPAVVPGRLQGQNVAVLFAGPVDRGVSFAVAKAVQDAGGTVVRTRSISLPLDVAAIEEALRRQPAFRRLGGQEQLDELGEALAAEFAAGGKTPLWDMLGQIIVQEREGPSTPPSDALVVVRTAKPQLGHSKAFLSGMYSGLARSGEPAVGTEVSEATPSAFPAFAKAGLSTVDSIDTTAGKLGLVLLLQGAQPGSYGMGDFARDGVLPAIPAAAAQQ
jgi:copper transport outer membrane protein MctB